MNYLEKLTKDGGFTLDALGRFKTQNFGYQVSTMNVAKIELWFMATEDRLNFQIVKAMRLARKRGHGENVGAWVDNGYLYLDLGVTVSDIFEALVIATKGNELAIYDWHNAMSLTVSDFGGLLDKYFDFKKEVK